MASRYGWGGYGGGWRRPYYGGGALAAGLIGGLALGTLAASAGSYYGYGYPSYYGGYGYYPSSYYAPAYGYSPVPVRLLSAGLLPPGLLPARLLAVTWQGRLIGEEFGGRERLISPDPSRLSAGHPLVDRSQRQQTPGLRAVLLVVRAIARSAWASKSVRSGTGMANLPRSPPWNQTRPD